MSHPCKTGDGSYTLFSERYGQTYHSMYGAVTESRHVFLEGACVRRRLEQGISTRVLEIGFGTGLNFFLTADLALESGVLLQYWALEAELLHANQFESLAKAALLHSPRLTSAFIEWRALLPDRPRNALYTFSFNDTLRLHLSIGDATCGPLPDQAIDAVYLDGFSPDVNPELWTAPFLKEIAGTMKTGGRLATYSARGLVRRNLTEAGFDVQKAPGPPGKREMLLATRL